MKTRRSICKIENWSGLDPEMIFANRQLSARPRQALQSRCRIGRNAHANAGGPMADVVTYSTALMTDDDRHAIAVYVKSLTARADETPKAPDPGAMKRGAQVYSDACRSCHLADGVGQPGFFPPLGHNALAQQDDATGLLHIVLGGLRAAPSATRTSALTMPSFAWKLSDQEIADVTTFLCNSWSNQASGVSTHIPTRPSFPTIAISAEARPCTA